MKYLKHPLISDIPMLKRVWYEGFPEDEEGYCDFYFERYFRPERCLAVYNDSEIESAVHWFDAFYKGTDGKKYDFMFLYASSTLKKYRGQKNLHYMVEGCKKFSIENGKKGLTVVSTDEIAYLYDRWGYKRISQLHTYSANVASKKNNIHWEICSFKKFSLMRTTYLDKLSNCFYWEKDAEKYMYDDIFTSGHVLVCKYEGNEYFAVCTVENDILIIRETDFPKDNLTTLFESISAYYSYTGQIDVYSHEKILLQNHNFTSKDIYYGHYSLNSEFPGSENLGSSYINLIAD